MKKITAIFILFTLLISFVHAKEIEEINAKSYILVDAKTGTVLVEKNPDEPMPPASITKIMVMLLAMESIDNGLISTDDIVVVTETAAIHEGSHVFLEVGEEISVNDLLKSIAVASGNDAANMMGEFLCGTQEKFVLKMNERAKELNMKNTHFVNCNGLDAEGHLSSARDIAIMTYELLKHPKIHEYTTIWMDTLRNGKFQLANTNKLIRFYEGATGMKTGSTSKAGFCISATASRNDVNLIAVTMNSETSKLRFADASTLLNYGFSNYSNVKLCENGQEFGNIKVIDGEEKEVALIPESEKTILVENGSKSSIKHKINIPESISAPLEKGQKIGEFVAYNGEKIIATIPIVTKEDVKKLSFMHLIKNLFISYLKCV